MNKNLIIILAIFHLTKTIAQNTEENSPNRGQDPCARPQIVTNPFAPQNTEWYSQRNRFNWMDYVTLHNSGKMRIPYYDNNNRYGNGLNSMYYFNNPFFDDDEDYLKHINLYSNTTNLKNQLVVDNDFSNFHRLVDEMDITSVEHGWELLWKFDGFEADGITPVSGLAGSDFKSMNFILYNRYTGMLRWFTAPRVDNTTFNELEPRIEFKDNRVVSLFRNYNGLDQALDKTTEVVRISSPAKTSYNLPYFSMADFNISYDPCVCYFDSKLRYSLNANTTASIDLYGRLEGTSQMLSANDVINTDRLLSVYKNNSNSQFPDQVKNGLLEYKNYGKMVDDFKKLDNKANIFDDISDASKVAKDIAELGIDVVLSTKKPWKSLKTISKFTSFASMPFKSDKGTKSPPMLIQAQMTLTGQLNSSVPLNGFSFDMQTPGSFKTSSDLSTLNSPTNADRFEYPVYNQAMGLYALLQTPTKDVATASATETTVKLVSVKNTYNEWGGQIGTTPIDSVSSSFAYSPREAFKLNHDLSYTFNPSAQINFDATKLEAAWMVEVKNFNSNNLWLFTSMNMTKTYSYQNDNNQTITVFTSEFMPIECISQFVPVFDFALTENALRSEYLNHFPNSPIQPDLQYLLFIHKNYISQSRPQIVNTFLKLNITYRYNKPDGTGLNDIVNFETYKYEIEGNNSNQTILESQNIVELSAPSELVFDDTVFATSGIIFAWDKVTLKGNISSLSGSEVIIKSAGEIVIDTTAEIGPEITLLIGTPSVCNPVRIQPTVIDATWCNNATKYKGNTTLAKTGENPTTSNLVENTNRSIIYPNPTNTGNFVVETNLEHESFINFYIYDIAGKLLYQHQSNNNLGKGKHRQEINDVLFQNGLYIVEVETNQGKKTYKLIRN
jgi:hypothetical protein